LGENHERRRGFPDFLRAALTESNDVRLSSTESRMQFDGTTKLHRKSGFGLHQLRNRYRAAARRFRATDVAA
jgi:hypothetical protein